MTIYGVHVLFITAASCMMANCSLFHFKKKKKKALIGEKRINTLYFVVIIF